jgi:hypothetical protein
MWMQALVILRFYWRVSLPLILISAVIINVYLEFGISGMMFGFWTKLPTTAFVLAFSTYMYEKQFLYYKNLGVARTQLLTMTGVFDLILFFALFELSLLIF